jgi:hypothetical protein
MVRNYSDREKTTQGQAARKCGILWAAGPPAPHTEGTKHETKTTHQSLQKFIISGER